MNTPLITTSASSTDIRHPEELSLLRKPRDPKKKKKKLEEAEEEALELEGPLLTPGSGTSHMIMMPAMCRWAVISRSHQTLCEDYFWKPSELPTCTTSRSIISHWF